VGRIAAALPVDARIFRVVAARVAKRGGFGKAAVRPVPAAEGALPPSPDGDSPGIFSAIGNPGAARCLPVASNIPAGGMPDDGAGCEDQAKAGLASRAASWS